MRRFAQVALLACMSALTSAALAFDNGQYDNVPADIRAWFKSVTAPNGVPCCDIADGHRTEYDVHDGAYWVPIEGQWMAVPERAIVRDRGNPVGDACITAATSSSVASCRPTRCDALSQSNPGCERAPDDERTRTIDRLTAIVRHANVRLR